MRLTTRGRFAVTAMIDLALREGAGPISLASIAERNQISVSYLEQLFAKLRGNELVQSTRGPGGGYELGRKARDISVGDVMVAVDEPLSNTCGGDLKECGADGSRCITHDLWTELDATMTTFLGSISLQQLADDLRAGGITLDDTLARKSGVSEAPALKKPVARGPNSVFELGRDRQKPESGAK